MELSPSDTLLIRNYFADKPVKRAFLFGSRARQFPVRSGSDFDILVELDHTTPIGMKIFAYQIELEKILRNKVDLLSTDGISRYIQPFIDKDKILIYERTDK